MNPHWGRSGMRPYQRRRCSHPERDPVLLGPYFLMSAGTKLIVVFPVREFNLEFTSTVPTRSRDSFTATSGSATMTMNVQ